MCLLWSMNWGFISEKTTFFIVTALNTSYLTSNRYYPNHTTIVTDSSGHSASAPFLTHHPLCWAAYTVGSCVGANSPMGWPLGKSADQYDCFLSPWGLITPHTHSASHYNSKLPLQTIFPLLNSLSTKGPYFMMLPFSFVEQNAADICDCHTPAVFIRVSVLCRVNAVPWFPKWKRRVAKNFL
jgi:hypothetical protein